MKETGEDWRRKSEGKTGGRREGRGNSSWSQNVHIQSAVRGVLSNARVTDVVLVSNGKYPVLKNPFKLVKPLTHGTLDSECVCG